MTESSPSRPLSDQPCRLHPDVVWIQDSDGSSRLIQMDANVCALDPDSTHLLRSVLEIGPRRSAQRLARRHPARQDEIEGDVEDFVADLSRLRLTLEAEERDPLRIQVRRAAARVLLAPLLRLFSGVDLALVPQAAILLGLARLSVLCLGWGESLKTWETSFPQPEARPCRLSFESLKAVDQAVRRSAAASLLRLECRERALASLALARKAGDRAELVIGLCFWPLEGHVWVEAQGQVLSDHRDCRKLYQAVARYGGSQGTAGMPE